MGRTDIDAVLDDLERRAFAYFLQETNERTGLVRDNSRPTAPATIAGSGFALAAYAIGAEREYISRRDAAERVRSALQFLWDAPQGDSPEGTGSHGFFFHFLDLDTGRRVWDSEISTMDSALALAGILTAGVYFDRDTPAEREVQRLADAIYRRVDWPWSMGAGRTVALGWLPESGFLPRGWGGYTEAQLLYILGLGSPDHPLPVESYAAWAESYQWKRIYGHEMLYAGPLFIHHMSQCWLDLRGVQDDFMRAHDIDYFENSRRAVHVHQEYGKRNPRRWTGYSATSWGITASDGPGPANRVRGGKRHTFYGYYGRGAPYGPDDGTLSPWAVVASLPFAPELVLPSIAVHAARHSAEHHDYAYVESYNPSFRSRASTPGAASSARTEWRSPAQYAINQGAVLLMIENYRSGLMWRLMRRSPYIVTGLRRAGFRAGWLDA